MCQVRVPVLLVLTGTWHLALALALALVGVHPAALPTISTVHSWVLLPVTGIACLRSDHSHCTVVAPCLLGSCTTGRRHVVCSRVPPACRKAGVACQQPCAEEHCACMPSAHPSPHPAYPPLAPPHATPHAVVPMSMDGAFHGHPDANPHDDGVIPQPQNPTAPKVWQVHIVQELCNKGPLLAAIERGWFMVGQRVSSWTSHRSVDTLPGSADAGAVDMVRAGWVLFGAVSVVRFACGMRWFVGLRQGRSHGWWALRRALRKPSIMQARALPLMRNV